MSTAFVQALTLRRWSSGEHDRVYRVLTAEQGMLEVRAQGAAKIISKLAGHLEPFSEVKLMLARRRGPYRVAGAEVIRYFSARDLVTVQRLAQLAAIAEQLVGGEQPQAAAYQVMRAGWQALARATPAEQLSVLTNTVVALCQAAGYALPESVIKSTPPARLNYVVEEHLTSVLPYPVHLR